MTPEVEKFIFKRLEGVGSDKITYDTFSRIALATGMAFSLSNEEASFLVYQILKDKNITVGTQEWTDPPPKGQWPYQERRVPFSGNTPGGLYEPKTSLKGMNILSAVELEAALENRIRGLLPFFKSHGIDEEEALARLTLLAEADPTQGKYLQWIAEKDLEGVQKPPESAPEYKLTNLEEVKQYLTKFKELAKRQEYRGLIEQDITRYQDFAELKDAIDKFKETASRREQEKQEQEFRKRDIHEGLTTVYRGGDLKIYKVEDARVCAEFLQNTGFTGVCIHNEANASSYLQHGPLYIAFKGTKPYFAAASTGEVRDNQDKIFIPPDEDQKILESVGIPVKKFIEYALQHFTYVDRPKDALSIINWAKKHDKETSHTRFIERILNKQISSVDLESLL